MLIRKRNARSTKDKFKTISDFLVSNRLKLNDDKTHRLVLTNSQTRKARAKAGRHLDVVITTPLAAVAPTPAEQLLGGMIHTVINDIYLTGFFR